MDLHHGDQGRVEIVSLGLLGVEDFDWICPTGNGEDRTAEEVFGELLGVECSRGHDEFEVWSAFKGLCKALSKLSSSITTIKHAYSSEDRTERPWRWCVHEPRPT